MVHKALQVWAVVCIFSLITHALLLLSPVHIPRVHWNAHSIVFEVYSSQNSSPATLSLSTLQTPTYPESLSINIASSEEHLLFSPDGGRCFHFHTPRYLCTYLHFILYLHVCSMLTYLPGVGIMLFSACYFQHSNIWHIVHPRKYYFNNVKVITVLIHHFQAVFKSLFTYYLIL